MRGYIHLKCLLYQGKRYFDREAGAPGTDWIYSPKTLVL